eukprot:2681525-Pleurochrysis_carterae.AAC.1
MGSGSACPACAPPPVRPPLAPSTPPAARRTRRAGLLPAPRPAAASGAAWARRCCAPRRP